jgi:hypothetical protein
VILVDANILVYAHIETASRHAAARSWLDAQLNGVARVGLPWASLLAFLRIATNPRVYSRPVPMAVAFRQVTAWLGCKNVWTPHPAENHADVLGKLLASPGVHGNLVPDAHLAAIAIEHGLTLCSTDGDFARFPGLRWENPLELR